MKRRGAAAEDAPAKRARGASSRETDGARPAARRAAAAKQPHEEYAVGDWLAPPFMQNQFQRLQKEYDARVQRMGHKPIVAIHTRPEDEEAGATWQWQAEPSRRRKRGPSAVAAAAAAAAAVDDDDEDEEDDEEEEQRRRRRRRGKPTAPATITPALTTGKYDLQCFRCLHRPPKHTAFVYVSELMRFYCESCFQEAGGPGKD